MREDISKGFEESIVALLDSIGEGDLYSPSDSIDRFYAVQPNLRSSIKEKNIVRIDVPKGTGRAMIVPLYDVHLGAKTCFKDLFLKTVEFILTTPNCYTILGGDIMESATRQSVGLGIFEEDFHLTEQMRVITEVLKPLVKEGKIIGALTGNHEMRNAYLNAFNPMEEISYNLGIPYMGYQGYIDFRIGDQQYKIFAHHGTGGGRTKGAKVNSAMRPNTVAIADLYITGHLHDRFAIPDCIFDIEDGEVIQRTRYYVAAGSFLQYFGGYPEMMLLAPASSGTLLLELMEDEKAIRVHY